MPWAKFTGAKTGVEKAVGTVAYRGEKMKNGEFFKKRAGSRTPESYIVKNLLLPNRQVLSAGYPGDGKTLFWHTVLYSIAYEAPIIGLDVTGGNIMIIDSENPKPVLDARIAMVRRGLEMGGYAKKYEVDWQYYSGLLLDNRSTWSTIESEVKALRPCVIMLDHLSRFHTQDKDRAGQMNRVADGMDALRSICGSTILSIHHFNKRDDKGTFSKRLRGSSAIYARSESAYEIRALSRKLIGEKTYLEKIGLIPQARKDPMLSPIRIKIEQGDDRIRLAHDGAYQPIEDPKLDRLYHDIFHLFLHSKEDKSVYDVKKDLAGYASDKEIRDSLRGLEEKGLLTMKITRSNKYIYRLAKARKCPWCTP